MGIGFYFIFLRPPLLPEDYSYIGTSEAINNDIPGLVVWLRKVFIVLGGYIFSAGLLMPSLEMNNGQEKRTPSLFIVILVTGLSSIGLMTIINFIIDSDFKWLLLVLALPWPFSLASYFHSEAEISIKEP